MHGHPQGGARIGNCPPPSGKSQFILLFRGLFATFSPFGGLSATILFLMWGLFHHAACGGYSRKVLTETGSRTTGLSFNVHSALPAELPRSLLLCYLDLEVALITRALYGVFSGVSGRQGSHMYVGSYMTPT